jgi:nucleoside-diphosphate-sugar epimerase
MHPVTVVGGNGYVGRHVCAALLAAGHRVVVPERHGCDWIHGIRGNVVFAAGLTADFRQRPLDTVEAHVGLLVQMLRHAPFDRLVYLSSTRVYAGQPNTHEDAQLVAHPADPSDLYNLSKLLGESLCLTHPQRRISVLRLSNVVGGHPLQPDSFLGMLWQEARQGHIQLQAHPESSKDYIHVDDVTRAVVSAIAQGESRIYNVASGFNLTHRDWALTLATAAKATWASNEAASEWSFPVIDNKRLRNELQAPPLHTPESLLHAVANELLLTRAEAH